MTAPLLEIENLSVQFKTAAGLLRAVDQFNLAITPGEIVSIVGESGSGKSVAMLAVMGLLPWQAKISADRLSFDGQDLLRLSGRQRRKLVGRDLAMIFQEPMTSLNPCFTVGWQLMEGLKVHEGGTRRQRRATAIDLLRQVGIPAPEERLSAYPHQLSGGMSQRVMIAMAIACRPRLLIADEPTTALDVTIQAQILELLTDLTRERGMSLVLITHDMGVVAETADRVVVQYAGQQMESADVLGLFTWPRHPYTAALLEALPERATGGMLATIPGLVPGVTDRPPACLFAPRCRFRQARCDEEQPRFVPRIEGEEDRRVRCHFPLRDQAAMPAVGGEVS